MVKRSRSGNRAPTSSQFMYALLLAVLFSGCAVGPDYVKPSAPEPQAWIEKEHPKIKAESAEFRDWWMVFNDPILDDLVERAYQANLTLQIAGLRILEARAQLGIAVGGLYPQQQRLGADWTYNRISKNTANTTPSADFGYSDAGVGFDAAWELDFWGKFRRAVESGMGNLEASIAQYDDILVTLTADVARTYILIRTLEERLAIARANVQIQGRSLEIAQVRFDGGDVTELDVAQARALLTDTQATIPRLEANLRQARNGLASCWGPSPGSWMRPLADRNLSRLSPERLLWACLRSCSAGARIFAFPRGSLPPRAP